MRRSDEMPLGAALRRAWVGYQRRVDSAMAAAGFGDRGFPDARVLRMCADSNEVTISHIGRELDITRQGAAKIVASLRERRYVTVTASPSSGREKIVRATARAIEFLDTQRRTARAIERRLRREVGAEGFAALQALLDALGSGENLRMRDYLAERNRVAGRGTVRR